MKKLTIADVKEHNKNTGRFFFSRKTMRFFQSRIESTLYKNHRFITSERCGDLLREYSVRWYDAETGRIDTVTRGIKEIEVAREVARESK